MKVSEFVQSKIKQWGAYAFARYCYNVGLDFEDAYFIMFGRGARR